MDDASRNLSRPKRTFLDRQTPATARAGSASGRGLHSAGGQSPTRSSYHTAAASSGSGATVAQPPAPPPDTKAVILAENRVEILDMLSESVAELKNIYRSKFVLGDHLRLVDPSYSGDAPNRFDLMVPPPFDPAFGLREAGQDAVAKDDDAGAAQGPSGMGPHGGAGGGSGPFGSGTDVATKEKLRTAEELIKKLFRRNTQLETENKYLKAELSKVERLQGISREQTHNLVAEDGHVPLNHPLYTKKMIRRCRSIPPQRTLMRTAVNGYGLSFPPRPGTKEHEDAIQTARQDSPAVEQLKRRVLQLTEALVAVQHDNEQLVRERADRLSLRDGLLRSYLAEHDAHVARLHRLLQDLSAKVQNPLRLLRAKQPSLAMNPVVVAQNILKEVSQALSAQIQNITADIVREGSAAIPPAGTGATAPDPGTGVSTSRGAAGAVALLEASQVPAAAADDEAGGANRRRDLARRLRVLSDQLPVAKRKQLLLLLTELKTLYTAVCRSNAALFELIESNRVKFTQDLVKLKIEGALLRDALRATGLDDAAVIEAGGAKGGGAPSSPMR